MLSPKGSGNAEKRRARNVGGAGQEPHAESRLQKHRKRLRHEPTKLRRPAKALGLAAAVASERSEGAPIPPLHGQHSPKFALPSPGLLKQRGAAASAGPRFALVLLVLAGLA